MDSPANPDYFDDVSRFLLAMPVVRFYGITIASLASGRSELRLPFRSELSHDGTAFQASASGALADFGGGAAAATLLPPGRAVATSGYSLHLLAPAIGQMLSCKGRVVHAGRSTTLTQADVYAIDDGREALCATALVSLLHVSIQQDR